jgi:hypothetical protein
MGDFQVLESLRKLALFVKRGCCRHLGVKRLSKLWTHLSWIGLVQALFDKSVTAWEALLQKGLPGSARYAASPFAAFRCT